MRRRNYLFLILIVLAGLLRGGGGGQLYADTPSGKTEKLGLFILGLSGSHQFKTYFDQAPERLRKILLLNGYRVEELVKFSEDTAPEKEKKWGEEETSKKDRIEKYFETLPKRDKPYEEVFVFIGAHANGRDDEAMMHLPGDDMMYRELMEKVNLLQAKKMIIVVAAAQGEAWIQKLAKPGRVIIVGNGYRQYDFIPMLFLRFFPEMFGNLAQPDPKDPSKDSVVSLLDVFTATQNKIRHWYKENSLHCTEEALIDADGDGKGNSLFAKAQVENESKATVKEPPLEAQVLKGESDEELPVDLNLPDAKAADQIHFIVKKGEKHGS